MGERDGDAKGGVFARNRQTKKLPHPEIHPFEGIFPVVAAVIYQFYEFA
ncbi:hypothetical protein [Bacteroides sedimenti]